MSTSPTTPPEDRLAPASDRFSTWVRTMRSSRGMTQDQLAASIQANGGSVTNGSVICHWESGTRRPNGMNLIALCMSLDVGMAEAQEVLSEKYLTDDNPPG